MAPPQISLPQDTASKPESEEARGIQSEITGSLRAHSRHRQSVVKLHQRPILTTCSLGLFILGSCIFGCFLALHVNAWFHFFFLFLMHIFFIFRYNPMAFNMIPCHSIPNFLEFTSFFYNAGGVFEGISCISSECTTAKLSGKNREAYFHFFSHKYSFLLVSSLLYLILYKQQKTENFLK